MFEAFLCRRVDLCSQLDLEISQSIELAGENLKTTSLSTAPLEVKALQEGGSVIFSEATGCVPGLNGRLNPIRDTHDRTYLYASNIAINEGEQQPVHFIPGEDLRLTDAEGTELLVRIVDIVGRSALVEYRPYPWGGRTSNGLIWEPDNQ